MPPTDATRDASARICGGDWSAYNERATSEVPEVLSRIRECCNDIRLLKQKTKRGETPFPLRSLLKCWLAMTFFNLSSRRVIGFLRLHRKTLGLRGIPHFNTLTRRAHDENVPLILASLIDELRNELHAPEEAVSVDSTGVATTHGKRWIDEKRGAGNDWRKLHTIQDVQTGFILAADTSSATTHDSNVFPALIGAITPGTLVLGDRAYPSRDNLDLIDECEGIAHLRPKKNARVDPECTDALGRLALAALDDDFWDVYKLRSSHESRFSMLKRIVKPFLRWKREAGQTAELLFAAVVHNLRVLSKWIQ